jgi:uncharacterized protein YcfJ
MLDAVVNVPPITDLLTVSGSVGTALGGVIGLIIGASKWRQAFEGLALGAAAGGVGGCLIAFMAYGWIRVMG